MIGIDLIFSELLNLSRYAESQIHREITLTRHEHIVSDLPSQFEILVWNIQKGKAKLEWQKDFNRLNQQSYLTFLQESVIDGFVDQSLRSQKHQNWSFSTSFVYQNKQIGVATGASSTIKGFFTLISPVTEPIFNTPKVTLVKLVPLNTGDNLLTLNIHGINFVSQKSFEKHILSILPTIEAHSGPIIWAGDFNTWSQGRLKFLDSALKKYNLERITLEADTRRLKLDHIYLRGCQSIWARVENQINTSDHYPIRANILCSKSKH